MINADNPLLTAHRFPLVEEIPYCDPLQLFATVRTMNALFLDSARQDAQGKYSFIALDPFQWLSCKRGLVTLREQTFAANPFDVLQFELNRFALSPHEHLPPFQGGVAGLFGYELGGYLEKLPARKADDLQIPELAVGFYDLVFAFDQGEQRAWVFSSGFPELTMTARQKRANNRLGWALKILKKLTPLPEVTSFKIKDENIYSTFTQQTYESAVSKVIEYIRAGDIFEANISQRFTTKQPEEFCPFELYRKLRLINAAPFSAFQQIGHYAIASASPERFLRLSQNKVEARPIKGTRPRFSDEQTNQKMMQELLTSEKDRAENIMIVDLMRNDLSRVCLPHSVKVPQLCGLETFATVHHLVSVVEGWMQPGKGPLDLLRATFPGGSITGAPKIRAMEIITELEPTVRGPYCGSMGYIGFNQEMDLSIVIRTFVMDQQHITFQTGGAITVDSDPTEEYQETIAKAAALRKALVN